MASTTNGFYYNYTPQRRLNSNYEQSNNRPISFYDNYESVPPRNGAVAPLVPPENDDDLNEDLSESFQSQQTNSPETPEVNRLTSADSKLSHDTNTPSLAYCLNTTVPQNIAAATIAGKHAPTRNSLRHSRMIVLSRTGRVDKFKESGPLLERQGLARALVGLQTLLGALLSILALWLLLWAPNIPRQDNPYWSGLPLLISGIFGLLLLGCCSHKKYKIEQDCCLQSSKIISIILSAIATIACIGACVFALVHIVTLSSMICEPPFALNTTCTCRSMHNDTFLATSYHYIDLNCPEVDGILSVILIFSCTANGLAAIIAICYIYLHWKSRDMHYYMTVQTSEKMSSTNLHK